MTDYLPLPEFIVVEDDPLVLMDIREMLIQEFNALPLSLGTVRHLDELLAVVGRPAVVIASCGLDVFAGAVQGTISSALPLAAVLIAEPPKDVVETPINVGFVPPPFSSALLLETVMNACARLRSNLS